jgi:hypothetical protein
MSDTAVFRVVALPGQLRKGDYVSVPGSHDLVLTEHPEYDTLVFKGQLCQIYHLTGRADDTTQVVKIAVSARVALDSTREVTLNGRPAPVFVTPTREPVYGAYVY